MTHVCVYKNVKHESAGAKKWIDYTHQNSTEAVGICDNNSDITIKKILYFLTI